MFIFAELIFYVDQLETMKLCKKLKCDRCQYKCEIFESLNRRNQTPVDIDTINITYKRHEQICKQGSPVTHAIYLISGSAKLYIEGLNNRNIILNIMRPGDYIGLLSFFESPHYFYSIMALEESNICMIDLALVKELYRDDHQLLVSLNAAFGHSVANIMTKLISLNQKQIRGRIAESLLYLSDLNGCDKFPMGLTRRELGELSGISEENAVRLLTELRKEKIIDVDGRNISILDRRILQKICEVG